MRVIGTGGGTGGHVYPALSALEALVAEPAWGVRWDEITWVGRSGGIEETIAQRAGLSYRGVATGPLRGANPWQAARSLARLARGVAQTLRLLRELRPQVVLSTGGYVSAPVLIAAWLRRCPAMIYLPDAEPGLAVRLLARLVRRIAVSFETVAGHLPASKVVVTGYPVRRALITTTRPQGRAALGLDAAQPVLLVLGGSTGARSINQAVGAALPRLLALAQVVHITGAPDYEAVTAQRAALDEKGRARYLVHAYLHEMADALAAADLVVARAGAATLGEFPAVGLPAILAPYPYSGQHQQANADYLAERGAAIVIADADLGARLLPEIEALLGDPARLASMAAAARKLARPQAAYAIARELVALAQKEAHA